MGRKGLTDEEVEVELRRVRATPEYKLRIKERGLKNRRRQQLYQCKTLMRRGEELMAMGITTENIVEILFKDLAESE